MSRSKLMISVIIPTFNSEQYIETALDSVLNQTHRDLEVIVCDDGSSDGTLEIATFIAQRDERVKVLTGPHQGRGAARNRGIDAASGDWITFVDSDDELVVDAYEKALAKLGDEDAGLIIFSIRFPKTDIYLHPPKIAALSDAFYPGNGYRAETFMDAYLKTKKMLVYSPCNKLYRRTVVEENKIRFPEDINFGEDRLFNYHYLRCAGSVMTISDRLYKYKMRRKPLDESTLNANFLVDLIELSDHKIALFKFYGYSSADLRPLRIHDAEAVIDETIGYLISVERQLGPSVTRKLIHNLLNDRYPSPVRKWWKLGPRRTKAFALGLVLRNSAVLHLFLRILRLREDERILRRRKNEINQDRELNWLSLSSAPNSEIRKYFLLSDYEYFLDQINKEHHRWLLRDKSVLLRRLSSVPEVDYLGREWLDLRRCTFAEFETFTKRHHRWIAKRFDGRASRGLEVIDSTASVTRDGEAVLSLYERLIEEKKYIIEEYIVQHDQVMRVYDKAVATLRLFTINLGGAVETVFIPTINFGSQGALTNNGASVQAFFDEENGVITSGADIGITRPIVESHPDSNLMLKGLVIPFAPEAVAMVKSAALHVPELPFIGWDVAITQTAPVIVEGNAAPMLIYTWQKMYRDILGIHGMRDTFENIARRHSSYKQSH